MTTYTWPNTRVFTAASAEWRLAPNVFSLPSQFSGHTQTVELPGARWMVRITFTPHSDADRAAVEAFLAKVRGKANRIAMWHPKRPVPLGTMRGSPVLAATEPRGETSLAITTTASATVKAGDMIKVGDSLLMVTDAATADGAGAITVSVTPGLKAQVSAGSAVIWDRPTATFILDEAPWVPHTAVYSPSFSISLTEA